MKFDVRLDIAEARRTFADVQKAVNMAAVKALKDTATTGRKEADQEIRQRVTLKSAAVKKALAIVKYGQRLYIDIVASGRPIALREFAANRTKRGVSFKVARGAKRRLYERDGRRAFFGKGSKLNDQIYVRVEDDPPGPRKGKIKRVFGPSIPQYFLTDNVQRRVRKAISERWPVVFARELKYRVAKARGQL